MLRRISVKKYDGVCILVENRSEVYNGRNNKYDPSAAPFFSSSMTKGTVTNT